MNGILEIIKDKKGSIKDWQFDCSNHGNNSILCVFPGSIGGKAGAGAVAVEPKTHPYMALIGYGDTAKDWRCGGSLITARYVISAAHCVNPYGLGLARWARLGELVISSSRDDAKPVDKRIVEWISYPKYVDYKNYHDIALFKLDSDVVFNVWVMPVCLETARELTQKKANFTGWGRTGFAEGTSDALLEAEIDIYNDTECKRLMFSSDNPRAPIGHQPDLMFCAGVPDGSKDACPGDSGGPLISREVGECLKTQVGITSYGRQCGLPDSPGVYTRVSNYIEWIEDVAFGDITIN